MTVGGDYLQDPPNSHIHRGEGGTMSEGEGGGPRTCTYILYNILYIFFKFGYIYMYVYGHRVIDHC